MQRRGEDMGYPSDITDAEWAILEPEVSRRAERGAPREVDLRAVVNALRYKLRSGCQWRMLPREFPPRSTVFYYFRKWQQDGTFERINDQLRGQVRDEVLEREAEPHIVVMDSQSVKSTQEASCDSGFDAGKKYTGTQTSAHGRHKWICGSSAGVGSRYFR